MKRMHETFISFYLAGGRVHIKADAVRGIGEPPFVRFLIAKDGKSIVMEPYNRKVFASMRVPPTMYNKTGQRARIDYDLFQTQPCPQLRHHPWGRLERVAGHFKARLSPSPLGFAPHKKRVHPAICGNAPRYSRRCTPQPPPSIKIIALCQSSHFLSKMAAFITFSAFSIICVFGLISLLQASFLFA